MKIANVNAEIVITYSWHQNLQQGICGHLYEVIDYYYILKNHFDIKIFLCVDFDKKYFESVIRNKYSFTENEIQNIIANTVISNEFAFLKCDTILLCDGNFKSIKNALLYKKLFVFPCGDKNVADVKMKNMILLQDNRIYKQSPKAINYVKKILLDKIKKPTKESNKILLYTTTPLRNVDISKYSKDETICVTNDKKIEGYNYLDMPVDNIFNEFGIYVYTPVMREFDCSPRFIAECTYFNKEIIYDIDYYDIGLETRKSDLLDLDKLNLQLDDEIINILKDN